MVQEGDCGSVEEHTGEWWTTTGSCEVMISFRRASHSGPQEVAAVVRAGDSGENSLVLRKGVVDLTTMWRVLPKNVKRFMSSSTAAAGGSEATKAVLVVGAGDSTGSAVARRFAAEGYVACVARRNRDKLAGLEAQILADGNRVQAFGLDARQEDEVESLVEHIEENVGPIHCAVHNIGANVRFGVLDTTKRVYFKTWEMAGLSSFLVGKAVAKRMVQRPEGGTIIFTGASASMRGSAGFSAFSGAMFAKRSLAQSMAREFGPQGIHVAHVVIDGGINTPFVRGILKDKADAIAAKGGLLEPDAIAENYWHLHTQPRTAWTHELDLRPYCERF